ncbi:MAG: hypothetical protein R3D33_00195 [Hyphomicrobiaceae bacterium]
MAEMPSPVDEVAEHPKGRLETFVRPCPSPLLISALVPVNRLLCLSGIAGLRRVPLIDRIPGVRGLADITQLDLPAEDALRLRSSVNPLTAAFVTPNHPEFFTDWMIDKELTARISPLAASWATNVIVNGMGPAMQRFWLKNNLIAQIPGTGGAEGKAYSVEWALKGHGVLLHPEGTVGWHGDTIGPLFPGAIEMAAEAARRAREAGESRGAVVAPVVWKLAFRRDVEAALSCEIGYVEAKLGLPAPPRHATPAERVATAYRILLARDETAYGLTDAEIGGDYDQRQRRLLGHMTERLHGLLTGFETSHAPVPEADSGDPAIRHGEIVRAADRLMRRRRQEGVEVPEAARRLVGDMRRLLRFRPLLYPARLMTQEQVAENIKRLRSDYCFGSFRDNADRMVPRPAGARIAIVRVPEPLEISNILGTRASLTHEETAALTATLRARMQAALDRINAGLDADPSRVRYPNPFHR